MEAECARGRYHFGLGHNIVYGGSNKSSFHFDLVIKDPNIIVDGKKIFNTGKYFLGQFRQHRITARFPIPLLSSLHPIS